MGFGVVVLSTAKLAIFDLLELAGRCTILIIAVLWVLEADDRAKQRHYRAWELINGRKDRPLTRDDGTGFKI